MEWWQIQELMMTSAVVVAVLVPVCGLTYRFLVKPARGEQEEPVGSPRLLGGGPSGMRALITWRGSSRVWRRRFSACRCDGVRSPTEIRKTSQEGA